jgi:alpha-amylase/alpha-mannosidase (GH57 family)
VTQLIVHGHFYQPPRENPWTGKIDDERSAAPFPNWNARILAECYAQNRAVPLPEGVADNYRSLSFDFGPTLLDWLRGADPALLRALCEDDAESRGRLGHGNALAHGYNHAILPLLSRRNQRTQVRWGLAHFRHTFGREAEGFWLPETAADDESLNVLAESSVRFTILSPGQLRAVRLDATSLWRQVITGADLGRAYRYRTRANREIAILFYDGSASNEIAFGPLLDDGDQFASRLRRGMTERTHDAPLFSLATDGESYGHHHGKGAEALAVAFRRLSGEGAALTNFAAFLAAHPARGEALLHEPGSWSCPHGVERWRDHCGCTTGGEPGWTQAWRRPLFDAVHVLDARLADVFENAGILRDPWEARDAYIEILLDDSPAHRDAFFSEHGRPHADRARFWNLLEMERYALLMFTSCGWFFDDPARLETRQVLRYAARALELCPEPESARLQNVFLEHLRPLRSNKYPEIDGAALYRDMVESSRSGVPGTIRYENVPNEEQKTT